MFNESTFFLFRNIAFFLATAMLVKYYIFLVIAPFYPAKEARRQYLVAKSKRHLHYQPTVSVVIPAWNEEVGIIKTIKSVVANHYQHIEVIVVNDGSTDNSDAAVKDYIAQLKQQDQQLAARMKYFYKENGGKGTALNYGISQATGEIIITVDADSALDKDALKNLVTYFSDPSISAVVGNVKVAQNPSIVGFLQQLEYLFGFYFKRAHAVMGAEYIFGGACAAFRREVFQKYGLFDDKNKTEDIEMSMRLRFRGVNCTYAEDVICYTEGASTVTGLINQRLRWKKGRLETFAKYRQIFFSLDQTHNKALSFFVLPYAMLSEIQLLIEPISIALLFTYSIVAADFLSLTLGLLFIFTIYVVNAFFSQDGFRPKVLLLFPISWPAFYILVWIEFLSLLRSITLIYQGNDVTWQNWNRQGIHEQTLSQLDPLEPPLKA